jgi:hypothetical protein
MVWWQEEKPFSQRYQALDDLATQKDPNGATPLQTLMMVRVSTPLPGTPRQEVLEVSGRGGAVVPVSPAPGDGAGPPPQPICPEERQGSSHPAHRRMKRLVLQHLPGQKKIARESILTILAGLTGAGIMQYGS